MLWYEVQAGEKQILGKFERCQEFEQTSVIPRPIFKRVQDDHLTKDKNDPTLDVGKDGQQNPIVHEFERTDLHFFKLSPPTFFTTLALIY